MRDTRELPGSRFTEKAGVGLLRMRKTESKHGFLADRMQFSYLWRSIELLERGDERCQIKSESDRFRYKSSREITGHGNDMVHVCQRRF